METETTKVLGIKETKELLVLLFTFGKSVKEAKENDGKIDMLDIGLVMKVIPVITPALDDINLVVSELKDLDEAEATELVSFVGTEVGELVSKEELIEKIVAGLELAKAAHKFIKLF